MSEQSPPELEEPSGIERYYLERREQSENNFLPNTGHQTPSCPSYRHEAPASPVTCINLLTGALLVRVQPEEPNSWPFTARRHRSSSVRRTRRDACAARRMRFSSSR